MKMLVFSAHSTDFCSRSGADNQVRPVTRLITPEGKQAFR